MALKKLGLIVAVLASTVATAEEVELVDGRVLLLNDDGSFEVVSEPSSNSSEVEFLDPYFEHHAGEYGQNFMRFMPIVRNVTGKEIVGFQFTSRFKSVFGDEVFAFSGESSERIAIDGKSTAFVFYLWKDNQFSSGEPYDNLKIFEANGTGQITTEITAMAFGDGSVWRAIDK